MTRADRDAAWRTMHAAGHSAAYAARLLGFTRSAAYQWSRRTGNRWSGHRLEIAGRDPILLARVREKSNQMMNEGHDGFAISKALRPMMEASQ